jgi:hypothetical protein
MTEAVHGRGACVNRVYTVNGHVRVACNARGGNVSADVKFRRCAF